MQEIGLRFKAYSCWVTAIVNRKLFLIYLGGNKQPWFTISMKKPFKLKQNYTVGIITVAVLASMIGFYMLIYVPLSENELIAQRFRTLYRIDKNIHEKIYNSTQTIDKMLAGFVVDSISTTRYIHSLPSVDFKMFDVELSI